MKKPATKSDASLPADDLLAQAEALARSFEATLSSITDLAYTFDLEGNWTYANKPLLDLWGKSLAEIAGKSSLELNYPPELAERLKAQVKEVVASRKPIRGETYFKDARGVEDYHEYIFSPVFDADGNVAAVCGTTRLTTERKRAEAASESYRRVLQLVAEDAPLENVLRELVRKVELESTTQTFASVLLLDADGIHLRHAAAPGLPAAYVAAIDGHAIGEGTGSCGTAAFRKQAVFAHDISVNPLWANYREVAVANGLRACWSVPIFSTRREVLGTFAMYYPEPREASPKDVELAESAARLAAIAIERKLSDAAVRESQQRYSQLVNFLPTAVYTTDAEGRVLLYNEAATTLWGRQPKIGSDLGDGGCRLFRPDGSPLSMEQSPMSLSLKAGRPLRGEEIIIERADGTRRIVAPFPEPIRDGSGRIVGAVNMLLDVTEAKRAEEASRRLAAIVESSDDAIISKDLNGVITSWNQGACRLFGYQAEEVIGKPITILLPPEYLNIEGSILERIRRGEGLESHETIRLHKAGTRMEVSLTVSPIKDAKGRVIGASKIVRDITKQKQAERKLERAHHEAVQASRAKDDFLAALSHELRTPLNPVLLEASEAAEDPALPAEIRKKFVAIRNNVELEARLIDDLLDITRITHGKLVMDMAMVDAHEALNDAIGKVQAEVVRKGIILSREFSATLSTVRGDVVRLQQVLWNVLMNAVKFTPPGGKVGITTRTEPSGELLIEIADSGIGMTDQELGRIFEAFAQGEHSASGRSHRFGGLGLGLAITRKLLEVHAGTIQACSAGRNQGSIFVIRLPAMPPETAERPPVNGQAAPTAAPAGRREAIRILLVEDHEPTRTSLARMLTSRAYAVETAGSMKEAQALANSRQFQVLISDIGLPDGTGIELINELRLRNRELKGIALTGYAMEEDIAKGEAAGFVCYLTKPTRIQLLENALAKIAGTSPA